MHRYCYRFGTIEENTRAVVSAISNPDIDIISHPDDSRAPLDYERVVYAAKQHNTLLEINNSSLKSSKRDNVFENCCRILELCKEVKHPVILSSDAHFMTAIADFSLCEKVLQAVSFPDELVINYDLELFKKILSANRR